MSWISRVLGIDYLMDVTIASKNQTIRNLEVQNDMKDNILLYKDQEIQRLTNLIFMEHGVIRPDAPKSSSTEHHKPISRRTSWPMRQRELERADRIIGKKAESPVDALEKYWTQKSEEAMQEAPVTEDTL